MTRFYESNQRYYVSVDCVVFGLNGGRLNLLLGRRKFAPEQGKWSLFGGFVRPEESLDEAARRVLKELTGLDNIFMEQVGAFGEVDRDPGARVVSVAYYALINFNDQDRHLVAEHEAKWIPLGDIPALSFDHPSMIKRTLDLMRVKFTTEPVGLSLLPQKFTLSQMQTLYEIVLDRPLDKRNFRKRIHEVPFIEATGEIDKRSSRRGAALYRFNPLIYKKIRDSYSDMNPLF